MPKNIAVIVEGAEQEKKYWNNMFRTFFPNSSLHFIRLPAKQNIYNIYDRIKKDGFLNTIDLVRTLNKDTETLLEGLVSDDFQEIYLFFDFDPQHTLPKSQNPVSVLTDMLQIFDNETEHGKLYVSYPMVEALRDVIKGNCGAFWKCAVPLDSLGRYKQFTSFHKDDRIQNPMSHIGSYQRDTWEMLIAIFLRKCACLFQYPDGQTPQETERLYQWYRNNVSPEEIFRAETALLQDFQRIFVLSAFPEFLLDYFKSSYWNPFPDISHGQCAGFNAVLTAAPDNT